MKSELTRAKSKNTNTIVLIFSLLSDNHFFLKELLAKTKSRVILQDDKENTARPAACVKASQEMPTDHDGHFYGFYVNKAGEKLNVFIGGKHGKYYRKSARKVYVNEDQIQLV